MHQRINQYVQYGLKFAANLLTFNYLGLLNKCVKQKT